MYLVKTFLTDHYPLTAKKHLDICVKQWYIICDGVRGADREFSRHLRPIMDAFAEQRKGDL